MSENIHTSTVVSSGSAVVLYDPEAKRYFSGLGNRIEEKQSYELLTTDKAEDAYRFANDFEANRAAKNIQSDSVSIKRLKPRKIYFKFVLSELGS